MEQEKKPNLVIVHSFPTNSILLKGFYDFLSDYFIVYPIDLPGFVKSEKPLEKISIKQYAQFVSDEIKKIGLDEYWVSGISFGFVIVNSLIPDQKRKGKIAIEPYLGAKNLKMPFWKKMVFVLFVQTLWAMNGFYRAWRNHFVQKYLFLGSSARFDERIRIMVEEIDARTFFLTGKIALLNNKYGCSLTDEPYVLVVNKEDRTIRVDDIIDNFTSHATDLLISYTTADHYPKTISKEYFAEHIKAEEVKRILDFISSHK